MDLSVVIPLYNESESIEELNKWIINALNIESISFEIIYINDGSGKELTIKFENNFFENVFDVK